MRLIVHVIEPLAILALAPLFNGMIRKVKSFLQDRRGPSVLQPYFDLAKLFAKGSVVSEDASWLTRATPYVAFATVTFAAALVPVFSTDSWGGGDAILLVYLFGLMRFFTLLAAMDSGSAFTSMGSSREATLSALAEPALLLGLFLMGIASGSLHLEAMTLSALHAGWTGLTPVRFLAFFGLLVIAIVEAGRMPVDNPATHLELTMIHEGLILEQSGKYLALMSWSAAIKQLVLFTILFDLFVPWGITSSLSVAGLALSVGGYLAKLAVCAVGVGMLESLVAKMRFFQVPDLIGASFVFSVLSLISFVIAR